MSTPGMAVCAPATAIPGWAKLALRVSQEIRELTRASMDAIESAVNLPLAASQPAATRTGRSSASGDFDSSNDPAPEKIPLPREGDTSEIDSEHAAMWSLVRAAQQGDGEAFGKI